MLIRHANNQPIGQRDSAIAEQLAEVSASGLYNLVTQIAIPRHYINEADNNKTVCRWLVGQLQSYGYKVRQVGKYDNIIAYRPELEQQSMILVGAHYDSVPRSPGADDNGSAVAALLTVAKIIAANAPLTAVCFVLFNREEDGLLGSQDFVNNQLQNLHFTIRYCHILEMLGYCQHQPGSQKIPPLPMIKVPDTANFLGIVGNHNSKNQVDLVLSSARTYLNDVAVIALQVYFGAERYFPLLKRSDHSPFWSAGIPALMWTDTAEFRNPHYHQASDTADTLDYDFLKHNTRLLLATLLADVNYS